MTRSSSNTLTTPHLYLEKAEVSMPFKSQAQRKFMYAKHPEMAKEWEEKTPKGKKLPKKVKKKNGKK